MNRRRRISQKDILIFTCGSCYQLAKALSDLTGWPMYSFLGYPESPDDKYDTHVLVKTPDDLFMDIKGLHTEQELYDHWGHGNPLTEVPDYSDLPWDGTNMYFDSMPRARELAEELVYRYKRGDYARSS